jgi:signal transduction histidine kinase
MRRAALAGIAAAAVIFGLLAEHELYAWSDLRLWLPDLAAGAALVGAGLLLLALRRSTGAGALLLFAGFSWWSFNFHAVGPEWLRWPAENGAFIHRGALLGLALTLPSGRPRSQLAAAGVAVGWIASVWWPLWDDDRVAIALSTALVLIAVVGWSSTKGRGRQNAALGLVAATLLAGWIAGDAVLALTAAPTDALGAWGDAYPLVVIAVGTILAVGVLRTTSSAFADRAVELEGAGTLRDALRALLGDHTLETGYVVGEGRVVDHAGFPLAPSRDGLVETPVVARGVRVGLVRHEPGTLADVTTRDAVVGAVALAAERARLRAEIDERVAAVRRSRRRLVVAEAEERRRLAERLECGAGSTLDKVGQTVEDALRLVTEPDPLSGRIRRAALQVCRSRSDLDRLARGLGGIGEAEGLADALERLANDAPLEVETLLEPLDVPHTIAGALWFTCAECLSNIVKHADAATARIELRAESGAVILTVADDGRGGADVSGSGLAGLGDRLSALDGQLRIVSSHRGGTTVEARLPLEQICEARG